MTISISIPIYIPAISITAAIHTMLAVRDAITITASRGTVCSMIHHINCCC